jgi:tetratricopeptide (TPR) repeat protein
MLREIWRTLRPKQQKLLRYIAEIVHPETEKHLEEYVSRELNYNQFSKSLKQLRFLDLVVVKSPANGPDTIELHPLVREFVRRQFSHLERSPYISAIIVFVDKYILKFRPALDKDVSFSIIQYWTAKVELLINSGKYLNALLVLEEASGALLRCGYSEEFLRLAVSLFGNIEWSETLAADSRAYDDTYNDFINVLTQLGRFSETDHYIKKFEETISGATARRVLVCNMRAYLYWTNGEYGHAKEWGKRGVELKTKGDLDTRHDCSHNLALAQRDSGEVDSALAHFLGGITLSDVLNPNEVQSNKGGAFYGNIGRCLFFQDNLDGALICLIKSAFLIEKSNDEAIILNQGWAAMWLGELFEKRQEIELAFVCFSRAANKWKLISPFRSEKAAEAALRISRVMLNPMESQDWQIDRNYLDWLKRVNVFTVK